MRLCTIEASALLNLSVMLRANTSGGLWYTDAMLEIFFSNTSTKGGSSVYVASLACPPTPLPLLPRDLCWASASTRTPYPSSPDCLFPACVHILRQKHVLGAYPILLWDHREHSNSSGWHSHIPLVNLSQPYCEVCSLITPQEPSIQRTPVGRCKNSKWGHESWKIIIAFHRCSVLFPGGSSILAKATTHGIKFAVWHDTKIGFRALRVPRFTMGALEA